MSIQDKIDELIKQRDVLKTVQTIDNKNSHQNEVDGIIQNTKINQLNKIMKKQSGVDNLVKEMTERGK